MVKTTVFTVYKILFSAASFLLFAAPVESRQLDLYNQVELSTAGQRDSEVQNREYFLRQTSVPDLSPHWQEARAFSMRDLFGKVTWIDPNGQWLALKAGVFGERVNLATDSGTVILYGNSRIALTDLRTGDWVKIKYFEQGHQAVARTIASLPEEEIQQRHPPD